MNREDEKKNCYMNDATMGCRLENFGQKCTCTDQHAQKADETANYVCHDHAYQGHSPCPNCAEIDLLRSGSTAAESVGDEINDIELMARADQAYESLPEFESKHHSERSPQTLWCNGFCSGARDQHERTAAQYEKKIAGLNFHHYGQMWQMVSKTEELERHLAECNGMANLYSEDPVFKIKNSEYDALVNERDELKSRVEALRGALGECFDKVCRVVMSAEAPYKNGDIPVEIQMLASRLVVLRDNIERALKADDEMGKTLAIQSCRDLLRKS